VIETLHAASIAPACLTFPLPAGASARCARYARLAISSSRRRIGRFAGLQRPRCGHRAVIPWTWRIFKCVAFLASPCATKSRSVFGGGAPQSIVRGRQNPRLRPELACRQVHELFRGSRELHTRVRWRCSPRSFFTTKRWIISGLSWGTPFPRTVWQKVGDDRTSKPCQIHGRH